MTPNDAIQHLSLMRADIMKLEKNNFNETRVRAINMAIEALRTQIKNIKNKKEGYFVPPLDIENKKEGKNDNH